MPKQLNHEIANALRNVLPYDFYMFLQEAWHIIEPIKKFQPNWHIEYMAGKLQKVVERIARGEPREKDIIFNVPPGTTKTTLVTIMLPAWAWLLEPGLRIINGSWDGPLAVAHATKSRDIIESDWYRQLFGDRIRMKHDLNRKSEYSNTRMGARYATSVGGSIIGKHGDLILVDDPINPKRVASAVKLQECQEWYDLELAGRMTDPKVATKIIIMQRLHENDLTGHLLKKDPDGYAHYCFPAELTNDVKPAEMAENYKDGLMDPVRMDRAVLAKHLLEKGTMGYAGQMLQSPATIGGNIIKRKYFGYFRMRQLDEIKATTGVAPVWDFAVDTAFTKKQVNDPTGIMAYTNYQNSTYVRAVQSVFMELPELLVFLDEFCHRNGHTKQSRVYIEPKASGHSTEQMLRKYSLLNVQLDKPPTDDKVARAQGTLPYLESGRMYLLEEALWLEEFLGQVTLFPNATHDEYVDLISIVTDKVERPQGSSILSIESF